MGSALACIIRYIYTYRIRIGDAFLPDKNTTSLAISVPVLYPNTFRFSGNTLIH